MSTDVLTGRWDAANAKADAAVKAIAGIKARGVTDATAALLADFERQLDEANAELDLIEWETARRQAHH